MFYNPNNRLFFSQNVKHFLKGKMVSEKKENITSFNTSYSFCWNVIVLKWYWSVLSNTSFIQEILFVFSSQTMILFFQIQLLLENILLFPLVIEKLFVSYYYQ